MRRLAIKNALGATTFLPSHFGELPSCQFTYQLSDAFFAVFQKCHLLSEYADVKEGLNTGNNDLFFRYWWEVSISTIQLSHSSDNDPSVSGKSWFPCNRGGKFRRWYGNNKSVIEWSNNGRAIKNYRNEDGKLLSSTRNVSFYFKPGITWSGVSSGTFHARAFDEGFIFNSVGRSMFPRRYREYLLAFLNSPVCDQLLKSLAPTIHFSVGNIATLPVAISRKITVVLKKYAMKWGGWLALQGVIGILKKLLGDSKTIKF